MKDFTRQETIALTETTSSRLAYLEAKNLILPQKYGNPKRPTVIYTWEQIIQIRAISHLREKIDLQTVRGIIKFLEQTNFNGEYKNKHLVIINDESYWVESDWTNIAEIMRMADKQNKNIRQIVMIVIPQLASIIDDIWKAAKKSETVDFESFKHRAGAKPCV